MSPQITPLEVMMRAFPGIPKAEAEEMVAVGEVRSYPPDTILCYENAIASTFYIILNGQVRVSKVIAHDRTRTLKNLGPGDFFGEMALIHNAPRAATVTTTTPTTVLEVRKDAFDRMLRRSASLSMAMAREVSRRLRENETMAIEDLRMRSGELALAYQRLTEQEYTRQEVLTKIAAELRDPLVSAYEDLQKLQSEGLQEAGDDLQRKLNKIHSLVNDILFLEEQDMLLLPFQALEVGKVISNAVEEQQEKATAKRVDLDIEAIPDNVIVDGDSVALENALAALLNFAVDTSPEGSKVHVSARQSKTQVQVKVQAQDVEISPGTLLQLFDRSDQPEQVKAPQMESSGLALPAARQLIEQLGGDITVDSRAGSGTIFTIRLNAA